MASGEVKISEMRTTSEASVKDISLDCLSSLFSIFIFATNRKLGG